MCQPGPVFALVEYFSKRVRTLFFPDGLGLLIAGRSLQLLVYSVKPGKPVFGGYLPFRKVMAPFVGCFPELVRCGAFGGR